MEQSSTSSTAVAIAVTSCFSLLILIPPLIIQIRAKNWVLAVLMGSIWIRMMMSFTSAIIWPNTDSLLVWDGRILCDIEVKLLVAVRMTIPGALTCIFRKLSILLDPSRFGVEPSEAQRRRTAIFDIILCAVLPTLRMMLSYVVQPSRYVIVGIRGCNPTVDTSWPSYALTLTWPLFIHAFGLFYGGLATWRMLKHYHEISELIPGSSNHNMNRRKVIKTYIYAAILFILVTPATVFLFCSNLLPYLEAYSWSRVHPKNWSEKIAYRPESDAFTVIDFVNVFLSIITFICFGLGTEAKAEYTKFFRMLRSLRYKFLSQERTLEPKFSHITPDNTREEPNEGIGFTHELAAYEQSAETGE